MVEILVLYETPADFSSLHFMEYLYIKVKTFIIFCILNNMSFYVNLGPQGRTETMHSLH